MARKSGNGAAAGQEQLPVQPVEKPIICNPYDEPQDHWIYDKESGAASHAGMRRPASYWYKTERTGSAQLMLSGLAEEERDDLPLVNLLRDDVRRLARARLQGVAERSRATCSSIGRVRIAGAGCSSASARPSRRSCTCSSSASGRRSACRSSPP